MYKANYTFMNKSSLIILAAAVIVLTVLGFTLTGGEPADTAINTQGANATSTATTTVSATTSSPASSSVASQQTASSRSSQTASVAASSASRPAATTASAPASRAPNPSGESVTVTGRACTANDLTGSASWARSGSDVTGILTVTNSSRSDCVLSRASDVQIMSGNRILDVAMGGRPSESILLREGRAASVWFRWDNWCGTEPTSPYEVRYVLPNGDGYLEVPVIDPSGRPSSGAPLCEARAYPSTVSVWW